ncbi:hypothetical protein LCGC14_2760080, partial [marine sediment metagenome]
SSTTALIVIIAVKGIDTANPVGDTDQAVSSGDVTTIAIPLSTSIADYSKRLVFLALDTAGTHRAPNTLSRLVGGITNVVKTDTNQHILEENFGVTGTTPTENITVDNSTEYGIIQVLLTPAASFTIGNTSDKITDIINKKMYSQGNLVSYIWNIWPPISYVVNDFSAAVEDVQIFDNELVVAMGASTKLYIGATPTLPDQIVFTQASDNTFAIHLAPTKNQLWRDEDAQKISNAIVTPETLTNWVPASPNQYDIGTTPYSITRMIEYGGALWVGKFNGVYAPNQLAEYQNQTPQLIPASNTTNCLGMFVAKGFLWVPSPIGLYRVQLGQSLQMGPELSGRPDYRFRVLGGVEWAGWIYLLVEDQSDDEVPFICKANLEDPDNLVFHEWVRLGDLASTANTGWITIVSTGVNPYMMVGLDT